LTPEQDLPPLVLNHVVIEMDAVSESSNKRRRHYDGGQLEEDGVAVPRHAAAPGFCSLLADLPSGAIQQILDFQKSHKERASLRLTCQSLRNEVEIFCKESLARLKTKHRVDDTFDARIRNQADLATSHCSSRSFTCFGKP